MKKLSVYLISFFIICFIVFTPFESNCYANQSLEYVRVKDGVIRIAYKYQQDHDMWIDFSKCGVNSIMGISALYLAENSSDAVMKNLSRNSEIFLKSNSDWVGPYIVKADNSQNSAMPAFTGGWHIISTPKGNITSARTLSYTVYEDGSQISSDTTIGCSRVDIYVVNLIKAYNTATRPKNREVLKENVHYCIINGIINVQVETTALEDVTILRYYGLQSLDKRWRGRVIYGNIADKDNIFSTIINSSSGTKSENPYINMFTLFSYDMKHSLTVQLDRKYGLGTMKYVSSDKPCAFTMSYGKNYFNLINGINKTLKKGQKINWRGSYSFMEK